MTNVFPSDPVVHTNYTIPDAATYLYYYVLADSTPNNYVITLPSANVAGKTIYIVASNWDASLSSTFTVAAAAGQRIDKPSGDGYNLPSVTPLYYQAHLVSNGAGRWRWLYGN